EVPPAPAVRHVAQFATGGPAGLEEGFAAPAGDTGGADEGAVRGEFTAPQLAAVPGHVGVVPAQPAQPFAAGVEGWRGVEVRAAGDDGHRVRAVIAVEGDGREA